MIIEYYRKYLLRSPLPGWLADMFRTTVSPEMSAQDRKWWHDERYAIYDLNVNSAAVYPQHEEVLDLATAGSTYTARGYAYAGGGRRITRVEISLNKGKCIASYLPY